MRNAAVATSWKAWRFSDIATHVNERVDNPSEAGVERYVGLEHLDSDSLRIRRWGSPSDVEATKLLFRRGDIIFGRRRAYQRKLAVADFDGICSAHAMVLRARSEVVLQEFLPFFLQTDLFMERAQAISVGSLSPTINWKTLAREEFALPPLDEQRRLAAALFATENALEALTATEASAERARRSLLVQTFRPSRGPRGVFPPHWSVLPAKVAGNVQLGQQRHPKYDNGTNVRPYLRVANVMDGTLELRDVSRMHFPPRDLHKFELLPGDILLNEGQSTELVGRSAIYRGEVEGMCFQKTLLRFRCGQDLIPDFAHAYFQHCLYVGEFARISVQTTSMAHLTAVRFEQMPIPVPPKEDQRQVVDRIHSLNDAVCSSRRRRDSVRVLKAKLMTAALGWE